MKAFGHVQVESDREFVKRILMELAELKALRENFVQTWPDNSWQGRAWAEFVEHYSGVVYDQATRWTWREAHYQHGEKRRVFLFDKEREISEAAQNAYLWLLQQLQLKLRYYERVHEMPLADFVKMNLRSKNLLIDYLRWRDGYLPKVIEKCTPEEKQVFHGLRLRLSAEEIAATMKWKAVDEPEAMSDHPGKPRHERNDRPELIEKILEMKEKIIARLKQAGQMHALDKKPHIALDDNSEAFIAAPEDWSADDDLSLREVRECFAAALRKLLPHEISLLQLFYEEKFTTAEILEAYQQAGLNLPHIEKPLQDATPDDVYKALEKTRAKLLKIFQEECRELPDATINSRIVLELLKLLGVTPI